jgi:hypothetical protein
MKKWENQGVDCSMKSGYAYRLEDGVQLDNATSDDWEIVMHVPTGKERPVNFRTIDNALCVVYETPEGYMAQVLNC